MIPIRRGLEAEYVETDRPRKVNGISDINLCELLRESGSEFEARRNLICILETLCISTWKWDSVNHWWFTNEGSFKIAICRLQCLQPITIHY
jgi:hypothetical protein